MNEREKAKQYALRLLTQRSYSSNQLRSKMREKGYSEEVISEWIEWLCRVDLLQDEVLLTSLIERELKRGYGPRAIAWKLRAKGFSSDEIASGIAKSVSIEKQREAIRAWASRKNGEIRKRISDLIQRGFDSDLVLHELREFP